MECGNSLPLFHCPTARKRKQVSALQMWPPYGGGVSATTVEVTGKHYVETECRLNTMN